MLIMKKRPSLVVVKQNLVKLIISGVCLGANWLLFFLACRETSVPTATLSYYLAPAFMVLSAAVLFKERITLARGATVLIALLGMVLASGVIEGGVEGVTLRGIFLGIAAAVLYASVVMTNKTMKNIDVFYKTAVQFAVSATVLTPYVIFAEDTSAAVFDLRTVIFILIVGILHTGLAYALYFSSANKLSAGSVAVLGYIDPVVSILVSVLFFDERISVLGMIGAILIIGASLLSELPSRKENKNEN
jgi:RarD protein